MPKVRVETRIVKAPGGRIGILLQLPEGWTVFTKPADARRVAQDLLDLANKVERMQN